jgi:molybdopterin biosynthesis enzyme
LYSPHPADDEVLTMWLVRHSEESLPILLQVETGNPYLHQIGQGLLVEVKTPNQAAQIAAAVVIGANRVQEGAPYLLGLLQHPTCRLQTVSQKAEAVADGEVITENLVRTYTVRDAAAGGLRRLGYSVTFDGARYQAVPPAQ